MMLNGHVKFSAAFLLTALLLSPLVICRETRAAWMGRLDPLAIRLALAIVLLIAGVYLVSNG